MGVSENGNGNGAGHGLYDFCRRMAFEFSAGWRIPVVSVVYTVGLAFSLWLSYELRFDFSIPPKDYHQFLCVGLWLIPTKLALLLFIGHFAGLLSYFSIPDLKRLFYALAVGSLIAAAVWIVTGGRFAPPRSVILADGLMSLLVIAAIRLLFRRFREIYLHTGEYQEVRVSRIGIIGAGDAGATLASELLLKNRLGLRPIVFFDDDSNKWNRRLHGLLVAGAPEMLLDHRRNWKLDKVIIAMPSAPGKRIREIVNVLQQAGLRFETVPSMDQLASGRVKVSQIRPVEIEDLLGREPVQLETQNIRKVLEDQAVMVTGAGGSIGSELCRQIATYNPRSLLLVERSEVQLFPIEQQMNRLGHGQLIVPLIADILDRPRMQAIFKGYRPDVVFHAAAHKHVPIMENHPGEAIKNNSLGTARLAMLALKFGVGRFVLISTDKAINPTSVMGATKRLAEIFVQSLWANQSGNGIDCDEPQETDGQFATGSHRRQPGRTKFMAVRFGNVLGSSGSVIPTFKEQIAAGGPITVTHPEVTRYFMTIPEAGGLVLQSAAQGKGGEIFVLDMGKPIRIVNLARQLIELSGLKPGEDIEIRFTGLRPGEKLFEELSHESENLLVTNHPKILRFISRPLALEMVEGFLAELSTKLHRAGASDLKLLLRKLVPEYRPCLETVANVNGGGAGNGGGDSSQKGVSGEHSIEQAKPAKPHPLAAH